MNNVVKLCQTRFCFRRLCSHAKELVSIDHGKTRDEASVVRQSVGLLELEMKLSKDRVRELLKRIYFGVKGDIDGHSKLPNASQNHRQQWILKQYSASKLWD